MRSRSSFPADKAANNIVAVWRLYYIVTLIQELGSTKTYLIWRDANYFLNNIWHEICRTMCSKKKKTKITDNR